MRALQAEVAAEASTEKVPWYKREISFSGKKKPSPPATAGTAAETPQPKVPWYKREISFKSKPKQAPPPPIPASPPAAPPEGVEAPTVIEPAAPESAFAPVAVEPAPLAVPQPKAPWYKREISFKQKPKPAPLPPVPATGARAPATVAPVPVATQPKVPWYKREISFKSKPKQVAPAQIADQAPTAAEPAAAPAPQPKVPWYKRELSLGGKGAAKAPSAAKGSALKQRALVGVKIGASGICAARVIRNGNRLELLDLAREPLARGVVVAGEARDIRALAASLAHLFDANRLPKKAVRLGISNNRIGVRIIEVSGVMDPKQLENAIRFRAQEVLPIALEDAVLDYQQLSESVNADGELVRRVLLVVAYRDLIDRYVVAFKEAGVRLVGIDLEAFGLLRALTPPNGGTGRSDAAHVVVSIGHERSTFAVSDGTVCEFTRVLEWGGSTLDVAIARQLNLAPSEAEPIKHALSLDGSERALPPGVTQEQMNLAADIARRQLQTFARELVSSLQYYQNQPGSLGIGDIVITGGTSLLPGLAGELQRLIGVSVRVGDPFERVRPAKGIAEDPNQRALAIAIGLAIED